MSPRVHVTFRHMAPRPGIDEYARGQAEYLSRMCGDVVDCRVLLEPAAGTLRVVIELTVPGERIVASHLSDAAVAPDVARPASPDLQWQHALRESFDAARRILQDYVGRRRARTRRAERVADR